MRVFRSFLTAALAVLILCGCTRQQPQPTSPSIATEATVPETMQATAAATETQQPTQPQIPSILDFLRIAAAPVGSTMYVWGGGWNEADTGAGEEAVTLGVSSRWASFAAQQDGDYDHNDHRYQIHDGLDCSGYVGWAVYNVLETENGRPGYVCASTVMAETLARQGLGDYIPAEEMTVWQSGDIMSMDGHVWIVVGMCGDGSVLLLHSSPPGVMFNGTLLPDGSESQASALAETVMRTYFPEWYEKYPDHARPSSFLDRSSAMRWQVLEDPENLKAMSAEQIVDLIFS